MTGSNHVFSTLSTDMTYTHWESPGAGVPKTEVGSVFIQGGANVAQRPKAGSDIWTPLGRKTEVSDEDLALLERNEIFNLHKKNGFITVHKKSHDVEKAVADMARRDASAPKTEADYPEESGIVVTTDVPKSKLRPGA